MKVTRDGFSYALNIVGVVFGIAAAISTISMAIRVRRDVVAVREDFARARLQMAALDARQSRAVASAAVPSTAHHR